VNFGFLDFSTLERRRQCCEREVALNRRLAPRVYLGVVPIRRDAQGVHFGDGPGVIDYAVLMRQLPARWFFDRLVKRGEATAAQIDRIAAALQEFYLAQTPSPAIAAWGRIDRLRISTAENFRQARDFLGRTLTPAAFHAIQAYTAQRHATHARRFRDRVRAGRILDCHGDLHLEHIHVAPRSLQIYDCIEFNDRFRHIDVASDVAFLAMDLDYEGRPDLASRLVHQLARGLRDDGLDGMIDYYKCYRAFVRGKVESLHSVAHAAAEAERFESAERARRYFQLALRYATGGSRPLAIVVMGRIASGKSTLARALGEALGWPVVSSDRIRKSLAGFPLYERSDAAARRRLYSAPMTRRTYRRLLNDAVATTEGGTGVVVDATFGQREHREILRTIFARAHVEWIAVELRATDTAARRRLRARERAGAEVSDARLEDFPILAEAYKPPSEWPQHRRLRLGSGRNPEATLGRALVLLARRQARGRQP
jgi:aminoglycoside phosphotransferase family enzyme/predicted kinase